jgi:hypothetical protein
MFSRLIVFLFLMLGISQVSYSQVSSKDSSLKFEIPIIDGVEKYLQLLEYPAYLVVALENNGIAVSSSGRITLVSEDVIQSNGHFIFHYSHKKGATYFYNAVLEWETPIKYFKFEVPIQVDTSSVAKMVISLNFDLAIATFLPDQLINRIREKITNLTGPNTQKLILVNLDELMKKGQHDGSFAKLKSQIMFHSYNNQISSVPVGVMVIREPGDAESISDQAYFFGTLAIWLIFFLTLVGLCSYRKVKFK